MDFYSATRSIFPFSFFRLSLFCFFSTVFVSSSIGIHCHIGECHIIGSNIFYIISMYQVPLPYLVHDESSIRMRFPRLFSSLTEVDALMQVIFWQNNVNRLLIWCFHYFVASLTLMTQLYFEIYCYQVQFWRHFDAPNDWI